MLYWPSLIVKYKTLIILTIRLYFSSLELKL